MIELDVEPGHQAYLLAMILSNQGAEHSKRAYEWYCQTGSKDDPVYQQLTTDAEWLDRLAAKVAK